MGQFTLYKMQSTKNNVSVSNPVYMSIMKYLPVNLDDLCHSGIETGLSRYSLLPNTAAGLCLLTSCSFSVSFIPIYFSGLKTSSVTAFNYYSSYSCVLINKS